MSQLDDESLVRIPDADLTYRKQDGRFNLVQGDAAHAAHLNIVAIFTAAGFQATVEKEPSAKIREELRQLLLAGRGVVETKAGLLDADRLLRPDKYN